MKILQVGLGSMGKRRVRNLLTLGVSRQNIVGVDVNPTRRNETETLFSIKTYADFRRASKKENPDAYIISTPPNMHAPFFLHAAREKKHFFVEIGTNDKGYRQLLSILKHTRIVAAPSCTYRFYSPIQKIHQLVRTRSIGRIYAFTHHMGQYLPDWHPGEDYRKFYVSKKESSALDEMFLFETNWLSWILNDDFLRATMRSFKLSNLDIETNDLNITMLQSRRNVTGTLTIELISKPARRTLTIIGKKGTLEWNWQKKTIALFTETTKEWVQYHVQREKHYDQSLADERMYADEIAAFLRAIQKRKPFPYTFQEEYRQLKLLAEAKRKMP